MRNRRGVPLWSPAWAKRATTKGRPYGRGMWGTRATTRGRPYGMDECRQQSEDRKMSEQTEQARREHILATIQEEQVHFVNLEFTDVVGMAKCVTIPVEQF